MASNVAEIRNWLKSKYIVVPDDWLEACLNWILEEHQNEYLSSSRIKTFVYEQWLIADLREIGSSCLPDDVFSNQKSTLPNIYSLQMLDIRDISQPSYTQLLKLRGKDNRNAVVSAEPQPSLQPWEVKPKRMMMITLTDGTKSLQAMEYKPIPALHFGLQPGTKLQICGPIDCRLGILLLTAEKIQILGGEVESLIVENNSERVLLRVLGQDDSILEDRNNQHPREERQSLDSGIVINEDNSDLQDSRNSIALRQSNVEQILRNSTLSHRTPHCVDTSDLSNNRIDLTILEDEIEAFPDSTCEVTNPDEFEDDDEFLTNLDYDHLDQLVQECSGTSSERNSNETTVHSSSCKIRTPPPMLLDVPGWDLDDFI